ncbi:MAG: efflux RND transporter permease subunit, partial [Parabacteroides sp.]|nr:efflux RND transporter permease subunit [Parabacteroides sp.]
VAAPIEQVLNGTPGMLYMESQSTNTGSFSVSLTFDINTNPDLAAVEVQNRVKDAESRLPAEVVQNGISIDKQASSKLMTITLKSKDPKYDEIYLSNYATLNVLDMLRRVEGVGQVSNIGSRYYAMQIKVRPENLAALGLTVQDIQNAIKEQNRESAAGVLGQQPISGIDITIPIVARGRLSTVSEFEDIVIKADKDGSILRLRDVAHISLEASSYNTESGIDGENAAVLEIKMLPGMNAIDVSSNVKKTMEEISRNFPEGITYDIPFDMTEYINQSINEVYQTLFEALILVILVVFLSLQNWRSTLVPAIAVPISLIGTFGVMLVFGFSLNTLTLLGLVLAIGTVVDDAIVVVETVDRIMREEKLSAYEATKKAMSNLGGALIATTLVLCAVFVPVSFLPGISGMLYRQFTITIAVSVIISTIVALTLSPIMCSKVMRPDSGSDKPKNRLFRAINTGLERGNIAYEKIIKKAFAYPSRIFIVFATSMALIVIMNFIVPQSFIPQEDQGYFTIELELPEGASLERTRKVTDKAINYLSGLSDVKNVLNVTGSSPRSGVNQSRSQLTVILKPWEEREEKDLSVFMAQVKQNLSRYPECKVYLNTPPAIPGLGASGGFEMALEARGNTSYEELKAITDTVLFYASQCKELSMVSSSMQNEIPQLYIDIDRDMAKLMGVSIADIFTTMKAFTGSVYVNDFNLFNRVYKVYIQADAPYRATQNNMNLYFVRGNGGEMIPIPSLGTTSYTTGPGTIKRFNMYYSSSITGQPAAGYSSGQAMKAIENIIDKKINQDVGVEWSGLSYQEKKQSGQTGFVLMLAFLFVFLVLAAQYESWSVPIAVLLSLPVSCLGAYLGIALFGLENNVYFQIGLVMLIGLAAKNAILIVEFAKEQVDQGIDPQQAAINAAVMRFKPIVMTSLTFILGMLPLVLAMGPGSEGRQSIGVGVFFGMLVAITLGIVLVPFFFVWIYKMKSHVKNWRVKHV